MTDEGVFEWQQTKEGLVRIAFRGRVVTTLKGAAAARLVAKVRDATDADAQLAMAKVTGNFKRGNERTTPRL